MEAFIPCASSVLGKSSFTPAAEARRVRAAPQPRFAVRMQSGFAELQPGDPGYKPKAREVVKVSELGVSPFPDDKNAVTKLKEGELDAIAEGVLGSQVGGKPKKEKKTTEEIKKEIASGMGSFGKSSSMVDDDPYVGPEIGSQKRGFDLLREDILRTAAERAGVGRQDTTTDAAPQFGEPGYKPEAYQTAKVSSLGVSAFPDDKNAVTRIGGLNAVRDIADRIARGQTKGEKVEEEFKKGLSLEAALNKKKEAPKGKSPMDMLPDYLRPLPEDKPKSTWKNY